MTLRVDEEEMPLIGDSADTLISPDGCGDTRLNPAVTPWKLEFISSSMEVKANATQHCDADGLQVSLEVPPGVASLVTMKSFNGNRVGMFLDPGAYENAYRFAAMLRLCDGVGTDVLHRLHGKLSEILDTDLFPAAKMMLSDKAYVLGTGESGHGEYIGIKTFHQNERDARE